MVGSEEQSGSEGNGPSQLHQEVQLKCHAQTAQWWHISERVSCSIECSLCNILYLGSIIQMHDNLMLHRYKYTVLIAMDHSEYARFPGSWRAPTELIVVLVYLCAVQFVASRTFIKQPSRQLLAFTVLICHCSVHHTRSQSSQM